jgi:hypothetical protein
MAEPDSDDLEEQELLHLRKAEIEAVLRAGEFRVMAWAAVAISLNYINSSAP